FVGIGRAFREWRFLATLFAVNFVLVPPVAWLLSRIVTHDPVLVVGVLLVLLAPCIDYVIVFTGLAGGDVRRLLAATPVLMLAQMALLPVFLWALVGGDTVAVLDPGPFVEAFLLLIVLPLAAAAVTQLVARRAPVGRAWEAFVASAMVPLMVATLAVVVARSEERRVGNVTGVQTCALPICSSGRWSAATPSPSWTPVRSWKRSSCSSSCRSRQPPSHSSSPGGLPSGVPGRRSSRARWCR